MINNDNNNCLLYDFVLFGVLERISRFYRLVHDMKYENMDYYTGIINDIDECLWNILAEVITIVKKDNCNNNNKIDDFLNTCKKLKILHSSINCLPIMDQQIELLRFKRLFKEGLMKKVEGLSDFSIGFVETTIQEVHLETLFTKTKKELFNFKKLSQEFHYLNPDEKKNNNPQSHITLPRIELRNPLAWTTIAHEISHRLIDHCLPEDSDGNYFEDFKYFIEKEKGVSFPPSMNEEKIKHHILEYWCDFLGTLIMGGAFLFSQCDAMFFDGINNNGINSDTHPPKYLRLWLIQKILINRLTPNNYLPNEVSFKYIYNNMQTLLRKYSSVEKDDRCLANQFLNYLLEKYILHNEEKEIKLASTLVKLLNYFKRDNFKAESQYIPDLVESLKNNYIIPSYRISRDALRENCTTIQDILLAGFVYREKELKSRILSDFKNNIMKNTIITDKKEARRNIENTLQSINSCFGGFDTCILRSIQISEYVNLLSNKNNHEYDTKKKKRRNNKYNYGSLLNENEIKNELIKRSIKIIPFIDEIQIGATSIDVRLGTSFQLYNANHSGILDLVSYDTINKMEDNSTFIDLDYLEGIVLAPNQFMLGHTMEYLVLPNYIAAELDGRSSYARLGIEIHMTAGFVEPGFNGVLTLELFNAGPNPVKIYPGLRIGQLRFLRCTPTNRPYNRNIYAKYKGLLRHNESLLMKDYEIACFRDELDKNGNMNG
jgi:dCTP deaminase